MKKLSADEKKQLKVMNQQLKELQSELVVAKKKEGIDEYVDVKIRNGKFNFTRIRNENGPDKGIGEFAVNVQVKAKTQKIYIPLSIASGKKPAGFVYQIEGTGEAQVNRATVSVKREGIRQVTMGTINYAEIPMGYIAEFMLKVTVNGKVGKTYNIAINHINYKLALEDKRYQQFQKILKSGLQKFA